MRKIFITENQFKEILDNLKRGENDFIPFERTEDNLKEIIKEELGISYKVKNETDKLVKLLESKLERNKSFMKNGLYKTYNEAFETECYGKKTYINYEIFNFSDRIKYEKFRGKQYDGTSNFKGDELYLNLILTTLHGKLDKNSISTIQHELHHCYENVMRGDNKLIPTNKRELYDKIIEIISIYNEETEHNNKEKLLYSLSYVLYMCFESEQRAFMNNLDNDLKDCGHFWKNFIDKTDIYKDLQQMRAILACVSKLKSLIEREIGISVEEYTQIIRDGITSLERKIGRIVAKNNINEIRDGSVHVTINPKRDTIEEALIYLKIEKEL